MAHLQTIQDLLKKTKAGKTVSEDDIPPAVAVSASVAVPMVSNRPSAAVADAASRHTPSELPVDPVAPSRRAPPAPGSVEIPRPTVIGGGGQAAAVPPVPKPRAAVQPAASSGAVPGAAINVAKAAANAPPIQLHTGPASDQAADRGNMIIIIYSH